MGAEIQGWSEDSAHVESPGGFEFGVVGWVYAAQVPRTITFWLDNTASVYDQYGRPIKGLRLDDGREVRFATMSPKADGVDAQMRTMYATHLDIIKSLAQDLNIDVIQEMNDVGTPCGRCRGMGKTGERGCQTCRGTGLKQVVTCAGWPQVPYDMLKQLKKLPPTPASDLAKIRDPKLRTDALRIRKESDDLVMAEINGTIPVPEVSTPPIVVK